MIYLIISIFATLIVCLAIVNYAPAQFKYIYDKYNCVLNSSGLTADKLAEKLILSGRIKNLRLGQVVGMFNENFYYKKNMIFLAKSTVHNKSVPAIAIVAHEYGHAMQYNAHPKLFAINMKLSRTLSIFSKLILPLIFTGIILYILGESYYVASLTLFITAISLFVLGLLYKLINIPIEASASKKALKLLQDENILNKKEIKIADKILTNALLSYVASFLSSLLFFTFMVKKYKA